MSARSDSEGEGLPRTHASELRRRAREILASQRQQLDRLENDFPTELERLVETVSAELAQDHAQELARARAGDQSQVVAELEAQLQQARQQGAARQTEIERLLAEREQSRRGDGHFEEELRVTQSLLQAAQQAAEKRRLEFATVNEHLADAQAQLASSHQKQEALRNELAEEREKSLVAQEETKAQRRRLAREFKDQRARQLAEIEQRRAEVEATVASEDVQLANQMAAARAEAVQGRARLSELSKTLEQRTNELAQERRKADALKDQATQLRESIKKSHAERTNEGAELVQANAERDELRAELAELRGQCETLNAKLEEADNRLREADEKLTDADARLVAGAKADSGKKDDFVRRLEMATEEVRELKKANAELEAKLAKRGSEKVAPANGAVTGLDWEAQKRRLLESLEADDRDDDDAVVERNSIEQVIRVTDEAIAERNRRIDELERRLAALADESRPDGAELKEMFDKDEIIKQEREKLTQSHVEWREKIGQAEIAISVERAKLARERIELEEKLRLLHDRDVTRTLDGTPTETGKPPRSRWLSRLGLRDLDEPT